MGALGAIVAVDPGCMHTGIVYMDERRVIDSRTVGYPKGVKGNNALLDERCESIWRQLERFLAEHPHDLVVIEGYQTPWLVGSLTAHLHQAGEPFSIQLSALVLNPRARNNAAWASDAVAQGREVMQGCQRLVTNEHLRSAFAHGLWFYQRHGGR